MTPEEFKNRIHGWIQNEKKFPKDKLDTKLERIEFNVMDAFYDYIYPEHCPECTRSGHDHDGECSHFNDKDSRAMDKFLIDKKALI